ncbi:MAG: hypothetical protein KKE23_04400 [Nanoarchaeota archaeon]|nr:hypothetical protein [Nanoarchaeota archaeon]
MVDTKRIARQYYNRKDVQNALVSFSNNKEIAIRYSDQFGRRPDILEYPNDVANLAEKGATSFHCSEELWRNPMDLKTALSPAQLSSLRIGWDLLLDIDSDFIEYSKIAAELVIGALKFHNVQNIGLKFSGRGGWHIGVGFEAFPAEVKGIKIKDFFPEGPRIVASYLQQLIVDSLRKRILEITDVDDLKEKLQKPSDYFYKDGKFDPFTLVDIDTILISSRHLYRMPYSINEKSGLASIVIKPEQLKEFRLGWARPERVVTKLYLPAPEKNEAKELMLQAMDWQKTHSTILQQKPKSNETIQSRSGKIENADGKREFIIKDVSPEMYPPCVKKILEGMKDDGKKRALFVLINFFGSINLPSEDMKTKLVEWNAKNDPPLRDGYILSQLSWHSRQKSMLPPNCDKVQYKDIGVCTPDFFCGKIKNPVNYALVKKRSMYGGYKKDESKTSDKKFKKTKTAKKTTTFSPQQNQVETGISKGYYKRVQWR